jgi:predicted dehydrogenase
MAPIRVGFMGISADSESWKDAGAWVNTAHPPYLLSTPHYQVMALCSASIEAARAAIKSHNLPETTKAYGSPQDLASNQDVDLVVCSVNVKKHYHLIKPSLAGKDVVEWPLGPLGAI